MDLFTPVLHLAPGRAAAPVTAVMVDCPADCPYRAKPGEAAGCYLGWERRMERCRWGREAGRV